MATAEKRKGIVAGSQAERTFAVLPNDTKPWATEAGNAIKKFLEKRKLSCEKEDPEFAIVIGGDGTLYYYRDLLEELGAKVVLIGSETTYRAQLSKSSWREGLIELMQKGKPVSLPFLEVKSGSKQLGNAINDVVFRSFDHRVISITCKMGADQLTFRGDGLIIATPCGSTGYSMSANGPELPLGCASLIATPICPCRSNGLPRVEPKITDAHRLKVTAGKGATLENASLILDGAEPVLDSCGNKKFIVSKSGKHLEFLKLD